MHTALHLLVLFANLACYHRAIKQRKEEIILLDGTYAIRMRTLLGTKNGTLTLCADGAHISGVLDILGSQNQITGGTVSGNRYRFCGEMKTALGCVPYEAQGSIEEDALAILAQTAKGDFKITGTRISK